MVRPATKAKISLFTVSIIILSSIVLSSCSNGDISGIEINTQPPTKVIIDGKDAGMSPYKNRSLKTGVLNIKLGQDGLGYWSKSIELKKNISTAISWSFGKDETHSGGYLLSMEKSSDSRSGIIVSTFPPKVTVMIGGENRGLTPLFVPDLGEGDKELKLTIPGYESISLGVRPAAGYKIVLEAYLAKEEKIVIATPTPQQIPEQGNKIKIKSTDTGWLRVRDMPSSSGLEIDKVNAGEVYDSVGDSGDWTHIIVREKQGWVSSKFVEKI